MFRNLNKVLSADRHNVTDQTRHDVSATFERAADIVVDRTTSAHLRAETLETVHSFAQACAERGQSFLIPDPESSHSTDVEIARILGIISPDR